MINILTIRVVCTYSCYLLFAEEFFFIFLSSVYKLSHIMQQGTVKGGQRHSQCQCFLQTLEYCLNVLALCS